MSKLFSFKVLIRFALLVVLKSPMTLATGVLLLIAGLVVPGVALLLWKPPPSTVAEVLNRVERSPLR
jgi:hypothetical protein